MIVTFSSARNASSGTLRSSRKIWPAVDRDATEDGVSSGGRLLEDLLEHEVPMAALLCGDRIPQQPAASSSRLRVPK